MSFTTGSTQPIDLDANELDAVVLFKDEATDLSTVQDLEDALSRFGYEITDKITRRELVLIYKKIKQEMDKEIFQLANVKNRYADAKEMRQRQINLRSEFDGLQKNAVLDNLKSQEENFQKASDLVQAKLMKKHDQEIKEFTTFVSNKKEQEEFFHGIQTSNLNQTISKIERPNIRYTKRLIELHRAETGLNLLNQYDDALKVRKMIDRILPGATKKFYNEFEKSLEKKKDSLAKTQESDRALLEEKLKKLEWKEIRKREIEYKLCEQRLKNHMKDMRHTHAMEAKLKPEMSVKPSALWQHRANYNATSASLRGQQLLDHAREKRSGEVVYADPLTKEHDFIAMPPDTFEFYP